MGGQDHPPFMADMGRSGNNGSGEEGEFELVRALGGVILRAQEMQVERILEQGKRLQETVDKQQCTLAALERHIAIGPPMPFTQATQPNEMTPQPVAVSKLDPKPCCQASEPTPEPPQTIPRPEDSPQTILEPQSSSLVSNVLEMCHVEERIGKVVTTPKSDGGVSNSGFSVAHLVSPSPPV